MNVVLSSKWKHDEIAVKVSLPRWCESWQFHILVLYGRANKCTKFLNTCVLPLVCSLDLLLGHNLVAVAVVVFLHSLITHYLRTLQSNLTEITNSRNEAVCFIVCNLDCSDIWWSYMHKINQSFKPITYQKNQTKILLFNGILFEREMFVKVYVLWETRVLRDICAPEYHKYYSCPCFCFLTEVKSNWQS